MTLFEDEYFNVFDSALHKYMFLTNVGVWESKDIWGFDILFEFGDGYEEDRYAPIYNLIYEIK